MIVPQAIAAEVCRQQSEMGWPDTVPKFAYWVHADGYERYKLHVTLTVGDCEQLVADHSARAKRAIVRWRKRGAGHALKRAARHILLARLYRCSYITLTGQKNTTEDDMPFGHWEYDE